MTAFLKALDEAAVKWALVMAALAVWLLLNAWLDGQPSETDAFRAVQADLVQAPIDERAAMRGPQ